MTSEKYNRINVLLADYSQLQAAFESAEAEIKTIQLAAARELLPNHAQLKIKLAEIEASLRKLADEHYAELFPAEDKKRTHQTPFGGLKYHRSSSLEFEDAEKVVVRIELCCLAESERARRANEEPRFTVDQLLRVTKAPNLEALENFDAGLLELFGIQRVPKDNFKVLPFEMKGDKPAGKAENRKQKAERKEAA